MGTPQYNLKNPAVKRILQEIKEVQADTSGDFIAEALENDIFEWHFVIRGPPDTEFDGGVYHGRILLPAEYPFKPPGFMMLTPNGRFETMMKICLSISSHHPEHWQPSWSVRTALMALVAFMPTPGEGALGSLDLPKEERRKLAAKARDTPPRFGSAERQKMIEEMHLRMLTMPPSNRGRPGCSAGASSSSTLATQAAAAVEVPGAGTDMSQATAPATALEAGSSHPASPAHASAATPGVHTPTSLVGSALQQQQQEQQAEEDSWQVAGGYVGNMVPGVRPAQMQPGITGTGRAPVVAPATQPRAAGAPADTTLLTLLAISLTMVIVSILIRKVLVAAGYEVPPYLASIGLRRS